MRVLKIRTSLTVIHGTQKCSHRVKILDSIVCESLSYLFRGCHTCQGMPVAHRFAHGHYIRTEVLPLLLESPEVTPQTPKACLHFISHKDATSWAHISVWQGRIHLFLVWIKTGNTRNNHYHSLCNFGRVPSWQDNLPSDTRQRFSKEGRDLWESIINNTNVGHLSYYSSHHSGKANLSSFSVHLLYQVSDCICIRLAWVWMILSVQASVGVRQWGLRGHTTSSQIGSRPPIIKQDVNRNLLFTHHMNPLFLSCQFSKLVRTDVDEWLEVPVVSTSIEKQLIVIVKVMLEVWCVGLQQDAHWSSTMTSSFPVYCWAKRRARSLASDLSAEQILVWNQRFQQRLVSV